MTDLGSSGFPHPSADYEHETMKSLRKALAASALVVNVELVIASGYLPGRQEEQLRRSVTEVRSAYGPDIPERELPGNVTRIR